MTTPEGVPNYEDDRRLFCILRTAKGPLTEGPLYLDIVGTWEVCNREGHKKRPAFMGDGPHAGLFF